MGDEVAVWWDAARATVAFVGDPRVRERWSEASSLPLMTVADLAGHLTHSGILMVEEAFALDVVDGSRCFSAATMLSWVPSDPDDVAHAQVRHVAGTQAANGLDDLVQRASSSLDTVESLLASVDPDRALAFPWVPSLSMTAREFFRSRILELVVHVDDLALSIGEPDIPLHADAITTACHVATDINIMRHGQVAVARALCRPDRNAVAVLRAF
jgi:hypothetical protein